MGQLVEKLFDMLFTQSRCARNQGLEMFWCFLIEISIFSQQKWVNWLKNYRTRAMADRGFNYYFIFFLSG